MSQEYKKLLSYSQTKLEINKYVMKALAAAEAQKKDVNLALLCEAAELEFGVGSKAIHRIIGLLEHLGFVKVTDNIIKKVAQKPSKRP